MSALSIQPTYPIFTDIDGQPLEDGFVWIGQANLDPQVNPINVFWDAALTIPAGQPIRTLGGYPVNSGTPARLYVNSDYSIRVMNKNGSVVYSAPDATERYSSVVVGGVDAQNISYTPPFTVGVATNVEQKLSQSVSVFDFMSAAEIADVSSGTASIDVTSAIQSAIDYANSIYLNAGWGGSGVNVELPAGRYRHTGIIAKKGANMKGAGQWLTTLMLYGNNATAFQSPAAFSGLAADAVSIEVEGLQFISGESFPVGQVMWNAIGFTYSTFKNVNFEWCGGVSAVTMINSVLTGSGGPAQWYNQFYSCNFLRLASRPAGGVALQLGDADGGKEQITTWTFVGGRVSGAGDGSGLQLRGTGNQFFGVTFEGMDTAVFVGSGGTRGATANTFVGCYWEGNTVNRHIYANALNTMFAGSFVTGGTDTLSSDSTYFDEAGDYRAWLPATGAWQITSQNAGVFRPKFISQVALSGFDIVDSAANVATIYSVPQASSGFNYLNAYANNLVDPLWESGLAAFSPGDDNVKTLGRASFRWSVVYAGTGTINTSDAREKQQIRDLSEAERAVAVKLKGLMRAFKFNDAVAKKGDGARIHFGVIAQEVKAAFESEGLVAENYAILCYDEWEAEPEMTTPVLDADGNETGEIKVVRPSKSAGDRYGVRYEELLAFIIAAI